MHGPSGTHVRANLFNYSGILHEYLPLAITMVHEQALSWAARVRGTKPDSQGTCGGASEPSGKL